MKFVLASQNQHKLKEMHDILSAHGVEVVLEGDIGLQVEVEEREQMVHGVLQVLEPVELDCLPMV